MSTALTHFPPSLEEARRRLDAFVPRAARAYAERRNLDLGPGGHDHVSTLSPYVKLRLLDEITIARAVLDQHSEKTADKFLAEVFWRTYWKGWMELRPGVWDQYQHDLRSLRDQIQTQSGLRDRWQAACLGNTGIAPFDAWAQELGETGYLHNHARMWFASIWIFTLELPWQLGADFFLRHLLDGDAAVNTLSWRWVAGIQTRGKTYLATAENIVQNTDGRFGKVTGLAEEAQAISAPPNPDARPLPATQDFTPEGRYGLLTHGDDADAAFAAGHAPAPAARAFVDATAGHSPWVMAPHVSAFREAAAQSAFGAEGPVPVLATAQALADWAKAERLDALVAPYAPVGPVHQLFAAYRALDGAPPLSLPRRALDTAAWPLATKGFFPFRKHIPDLIARFVDS